LDSEEAVGQHETGDNAGRRGGLKTCSVEVGDRLGCELKPVGLVVIEVARAMDERGRRSVDGGKLGRMAVPRRSQQGSTQKAHRRS
jgi:hypothetical protein